MVAESLYKESETLSELSRKRVTTAIFDVDNTLIRTNITEFYFYLRKRRFSGYFGGARYLLWMAGFALFWAPYYLALDYFDREAFQRAFYRRYHKFTREELDHSAEAFFEEVLKPKRIVPTYELLQRLKKDGMEVVLLSTNFEPIIRQVARYFDVPYHCLKVTAGPDGAIVDLSDLTEFKKHVIRQYDPATTMAVADSKHDLPVLRHVETPYVVSDTSRRWMRKIGRAYVRIPRRG